MATSYITAALPLRPVDGRAAVANPATTLSFSAIISALSFAIDLTEGAIPGHAVRSCILGMRLAKAMALPEQHMLALYHALLLKDVGCSSNAARMCQIVGGDDRAVKHGVKLEDWTKPHRPTLHALRLLWRQVMPQASALRRAGRIGRLALTQHRNNAEMITLRCERGADIVKKLGLAPRTAEAIHALDEHWDGSGYPLSLKGKAIPLLARILAIAQHLDVFASERNPVEAIRVLRERSGRWFDPELVEVVCELDRQGALWTGCLHSDGEESARSLVLKLEPNHTDVVRPEQVDRICEAFAAVVDAKSPFTYRHSVGVAEVATALARLMELPADRVQLVRRAALLHDLGKLAVSNTILDKQSELTGDEWDAVMRHPRLTREILERIEPFAEIAQVAGAHHEKLDGTGYPDHLVASQLSLEARIVAVADVYQAITEGRPYRAAMSHDEAMEIMNRLAPHKLDIRCVAALALLNDPWPTWKGSSAMAVRKAPRSDKSFVRQPALHA